MKYKPGSTVYTRAWSTSFHPQISRWAVVEVHVRVGEVVYSLVSDCDVSNRVSGTVKTALKEEDVFSSFAAAKARMFDELREFHARVEKLVESE